LVVRRIILLCFACLSFPAHATTRGAPQDAVHSVIIHAVSGPACQGGTVVYSGAPGDAARWKGFFDRHPFLGIHYVVDRDGRALASTPETRQANHARDAKGGTIGIELVHQGDGVEPFSDVQFSALVKLVDGIRRRHNVAIENIKGHGDIDSRTFNCGGRAIKGRSDPGANFPWERLREALRGGPVLPRPAEPQMLVARTEALPVAMPELVRGPTLATRPPTTIEQLLQRIYK
jgi:N-acetylmuramoyl-L-alanine amidase